MSGQQCVTMTARIAEPGTCRRTKAKMWRIANPNQTEAPMSKSDRSVRIRELNDSLRSTFTGGKVVMTQGVAALPEHEITQLLERVRRFDQFSKDNDPYGEHDFGNFQLAGQTYFFKVDYYAPEGRRVRRSRRPHEDDSPAHDHARR
jgi:Protein of unknown function (DUF3768)